MNVVCNQDEVFDVSLISDFSDIISISLEADRRNFNNELLIYAIYISDKENNAKISGNTNIALLKEFLESRTVIMYNSKYVMPALYTIGIIPFNVECILVNEQVLNMGVKGLDTSIASIARMNDCNISGFSTYEEIFEGLKSIILISEKQKERAKNLDCLMALKFESLSIPAISYFRWCGFKIDFNIWDEITSNLKAVVDDRINRLNEFVFEHFKKDSKVCRIDTQGDLFEGFKNEKTCFIKWTNSDKSLDFINNNKFFIDNPDRHAEIKALYDEYNKSVSMLRMYGKNYKEAVDLCTGRIHPIYNQVTSEGRISSPIKGKNKYGGDIFLASAMNLPKEFRRAVVPEEGNVFIECDWTACEMAIIASISGDERLIDIVNKSDIHQFIADKFGLSRSDAKTLNFQIIYCGTDEGISRKLGIPVERANRMISEYPKMFPKLVKFITRVINAPIDLGYIPMHAGYGYRQEIDDIEKLRMTKNMFSQKFWKSYQLIKNNPNDMIVKDVKNYFSRKRDLDRISINSKVKNYGAIMFKLACSIFFKWIVKNNLFGKVKMVIPLHDSITVECPVDMKELVTEKLNKAMNVANEKICPNVFIKVKTTER